MSFALTYDIEIHSLDIESAYLQTPFNDDCYLELGQILGVFESEALAKMVGEAAAAASPAPAGGAGRGAPLASHGAAQTWTSSSWAAA